VRRALVLALGVLALVLAAAGLWARLLAGGPVGPIPGGHLAGEPATSVPDDWSFAAREPYLDVEVRGRWLPYSARVWFLVDQGRIHLLLPSLFGDGVKRRLDEDPSLRIRVGGRLYALHAVPMETPEDFGPFVRSFVRRQLAVEVSGPVRALGRRPGGPTVWLYRLEP
jgi:hypothetical protein